MTELNSGQQLARRWYERLEIIPFEEAERMLYDKPVITTMHGNTRDTMSREKAIRLLTQHSRRLRGEAASFYVGHDLVTIDDDEFPVHLQTMSDDSRKDLKI